VADNSGAKQVKCIKILTKGGPSKYAKVGDFILVSVISLNVKKGVGKKGNPASRTQAPKKGDIYKALVIRTKKTTSNIGNLFYGQRIAFQENTVVLTNPSGDAPLGSRILGPMSREIRAKKLNKLMSQSKGVL
jgi:large subunit ribosomal protein L14